MSDAVVAAIIGGQALVLAAVLPLLISTRRGVRQTREQVTNDHNTNLRVEGDQRHEENQRTQSEILRLQRAQGRRIGRVDRRITAINIRLAIVEDTIPRKAPK